MIEHKSHHVREKSASAQLRKSVQDIKSGMNRFSKTSKTERKENIQRSATPAQSRALNQYKIVNSGDRSAKKATNETIQSLLKVLQNI